jgi:hypothetical protein
MAHVAQLISERIATDRAKDTRVKDAFHVTDLGKCLRGVYLKRLHNIDGFDDRQLRIFRAGHLFEEFIISSIPESTISELQGTCVWPELNLMGSFDLLTKEADGYHLYELKSQNSQSFHYMLDAANPLHIQQVLLYASKIQERIPLAGIHVFYLSKDDLCSKQFDVPYDQAIVDAALLKAKYLKECWDKGILPDVPPTLVVSSKKKTAGKFEVNWVARFCDVHAQCLGDESWEAKAKSEADSMNK